MDEGRIVGLARCLATVSTRRAPVRGLSGAALTTFFMHLAQAGPVASKNGKKDNKKKGKKEGKRARASARHSTSSAPQVKS